MSSNDILNDTVKGVLTDLMSKLKEKDDDIKQLKEDNKRLEDRTSMIMAHTDYIRGMVKTLEEENTRRGDIQKKYELQIESICKILLKKNHLEIDCLNFFSPSIELSIFAVSRDGGVIFEEYLFKEGLSFLSVSQFSP
jgi:hypothetical protein